MAASPSDSEQGTEAEVQETYAPSPDERFVLPVLFALGCGYSSLLLLTELLPFVDLPFHLGVATVVRGYGDAGNQFSDYFTLQIAGQPNVFHLWFCSRPIFPSVEFANKVYFALYTFLLPLSIYSLIREIRGNTWFSILAFLYLYNFCTQWGFVGFVAAMPAVFFLFAVVLRHLQRPSHWTRLTIGLGIFGLFFIHVLATLFFLLVFGVACLVDQGKDVRKCAKSLALAAPALMLIGWWWSGTSTGNGETLFEFLLTYYQNSFLRSLQLRSFFFIFDNSYLDSGRMGLIWGGLFAALSVSFIVWAAIFEWSSFKTAIKQGKNRIAFAFVVVAALCFFLLPEGLPGQWALNQRFSVYFILGLIVLSSIFDYRELPRGLLIAGILGACLVHGALYADFFRDFGIETTGFTEDILPEAGETRLAGLILEPHFRGILSYLHFSNYYIIRKQGIAVTSMVDFRFGTIRRKTDGLKLPNELRRPDVKRKYGGEYDDIDYLVVRGEIPSHMRDSLYNFEETTRAGAWALLERR